LNIPKRMSGLGVQTPDIDRLVEGANSDPSCGGNPVPLTKENLRHLFQEVL